MDAEVLFVEDRTETEFILREFTPGAEKSQISEGAYLGYWLGIYNTSISDSRALSFYSDPERPISYFNFAQGEPMGDNKCFSMNAKTGYWQGQGSILQVKLPHGDYYIMWCIAMNIWGIWKNWVEH